jgi:hypothetical protein
MKKLLIIAAILLAACSSTATTQSAQVKYVQACAAYNAAFTTALNMRIAGKLTPAQIQQVTLLDDQITPICTGSLPASPEAATAQITTAITTLTVMEAIK